MNEGGRGDGWGDEGADALMDEWGGWASVNSARLLFESFALSFTSLLYELQNEVRSFTSPSRSSWSGSASMAFLPLRSDPVRTVAPVPYHVRILPTTTHHTGRH